MKLAFMVSCVVAFAAAALAAERTDPRATLEQWVETRQLISKTRADWQADKELLEQSAALYERELKSLGEGLAKVSTNSTQVDLERATALKQQAELDAAATRVKELVTELEKRVTVMAATFPPTLAEKVQPLLKRIPADPAATRASGLERMQNVVGLINEVDKFNAAVTVVSEIQKNPSGAEVQVETMYLGLAQAYFVDKAGEYAGVGTPGTNGWQWAAKPELAGAIQKSIAMHKNAAPAAFVSLPVQIK